MPLQDRIQNIIVNAVKNGECAGANVLVRKNGESILYAEAGMADIESGRPIRRNSIFRLYSQTKPITAAAVMILVERGLIDLMDGVDKYLPGFRKTLEREDFDMTIGGILRGCMENLEELSEDVGDAEAVTADMQQFRQEKDFESLFHLYLRLIEAELWDIQHVDRHLACLEATYDAWVDAEGEEEEED